MSRNSAKSAGRSAKTLRRSSKTASTSAKKSAKGARGAVKKASKTARRTSPKAAAHSRGTAVRAPSVAPKLGPRIIRTPSPPVQPVATSEIELRPHKYRIGDTVYYTSPTFGRAAATGSYKVVKLLPSEGDDYQYRIKSTGEAFERVAKESQLDRA